MYDFVKKQEFVLPKSFVIPNLFRDNIAPRQFILKQVQDDDNGSSHSTN